VRACHRCCCSWSEVGVACLPWSMTLATARDNRTLVVGWLSSSTRHTSPPPPTTTTHPNAPARRPAWTPRSPPPATPTTPGRSCPWSSSSSTCPGGSQARRPAPRCRPRRPRPSPLPRPQWACPPPGPTRCAPSLRWGGRRQAAAACVRAVRAVHACCACVPRVLERREGAAQGAGDDAVHGCGDGWRRWLCRRVCRALSCRFAAALGEHTRWSAPCTPCPPHPRKHTHTHTHTQHP
jgi:hypothetical protein